MDRGSFGAWGRELSPDEFAQALAALGAVNQPLLSPDPQQPFDPFQPIVSAVWPPPSESPAAFTGQLLQRLSVFSPPTQYQTTPAQLLTWWLPPETPYGDRLQGDVALAATLAEAWRGLRPFVGTLPEDGLRLELDFDTFSGDDSPIWAIEELSRLRSSSNVSPYVGLPETVSGRRRSGWSWPLRVALLPDDESQRLRAVLSDDHWAGSLFDLTDHRMGEETADLLIVPFGLTRTLTQLLERPVRASFVLFLGALTTSWDRARPTIMALLAHTRAAGAAFLPVPTIQHGRYFHELIRAVSHDLTLDAALDAARVELSSRLRSDSLPPPADPEASIDDADLLDAITPVLFAERALLQNTRLRLHLPSLSRRLSAFKDRAAIPEHAVEELASEVERLSVNSGLPQYQADYHRQVVQAEQLETLTFDFESEGATAAASLTRALDARPVPAPESRFVQAQVFDLDIARHDTEATEPPLLQQAFRAEAVHAVDVFIAPPTSNAIPASQRFPDEALSERDKEHQLLVVFTDLALRTEAQSGFIALPPTGPSSTYRFTLQTGPAGTPVRARLAVLHRQRVLQTAVLRGAVMTAPDETSADNRITLDVETMVHARIDDLDSRRPFDAALVINHTDESEDRLTFVTPERVVIKPSGNSRGRAQAIRATLENSVTQGVTISTMRDQHVEELLFDLAHQGTELYKFLNRIGTGPALKEANRIQIVEVQTETYFPLEFVYERWAPDDGAPICPGAEDSLPTGKCAASCPKPGSDRETTVICPLAFWGLSKEIERQVAMQATDDGATTQLRLGRLESATLAASNRVDAAAAGMIASVEQAISAALDKPVGRRRTWTEWRSAIISERPDLLVLLPHTVQASGVGALDIDDVLPLRVSQIRPPYVAVSGQERPIVLLLGCETAVADVPFQEFPASFLEAGAPMVVGTLTKILGRHAAPVAIELVTKLVKRSNGPPSTFGQLMLDLRRELLAAGIPTALVVTAYGNTDWVLGE